MVALDFLLPVRKLSKRNLSKNERMLLEADIFSQCYEAALQHHRIKSNGQLETKTDTLTKDNEIMVDDKLMKCVINDILESDTYTISGISYYTQIPEDVLIDLAAGLHINPSLNLSQKLIILHKSVRPKVYEHIYHKINRNLDTVQN